MSPRGPNTISRMICTSADKDSKKDCMPPNAICFPHSLSIQAFRSLQAPCPRLEGSHSRNGFRVCIQGSRFKQSYWPPVQPFQNFSRFNEVGPPLFSSHICTHSHTFRESKLAGPLLRIVESVSRPLPFSDLHILGSSASITQGMSMG